MLEFLFHSQAPGPVRWLCSAAVLGLALVLLFYRLGDGSLYDWDEAIYAQSAKEMFQTHEWRTLSWNGHPFFHKPPVYFWLTAFAYKIIGVNEFAARLWAAIFGFGVIGLTFVLGVRLRSWAVGTVAVLLLLVVDRAYYSQWWNFLSLSRVGMLDIPLTFWITLTLLLVWEAEERPWLLALLGFPIGLALLTKAWPGAFAAAIAVTHWKLRRLSPPGQTGLWVIAVLVTAAVVLPWHLWQYSLYGPLFLREYVGFNLLERSLSVLEEHSGSPFFYLGIVRRGFSLWGSVWPLAYFWAVWKVWRAEDRGGVLLLSWVSIPLLLFSMAQTKLGWYISMIYPAVALLIAIALADLLTDRVSLGLVAAVMMVCCLRLPAPADGSPDVKQFAPRAAASLVPSDVVYVIKADCGGAEPTLTAGTLLVTEGHTRAALLFYLDHPLTCIEERQVLRATPPPEAYMISDKQSWTRFSHLGSVVLDAGGYILARWR